MTARRGNAVAWLLGGALMLAGAPARAQEPETETALHEAWLDEILDLDVAAATAAYQRLAATARPGNGERWIATARLLELQRLQVPGVEAPPVTDAPTPLRAAFAAIATPLPSRDLLARVHGNPKDVLAALNTEASRLPALRPVVPTAQAWWLDQIGPSQRDRWRQRMAAIADRGRGDEARATERLYAAEVLRAELDGNRAQAQSLRTLYFADWRPPVVTGAPAELVARARGNLAAMVAETGPDSTAGALLRQLATAIDERAAADPADALALVQSLPLYAERLLQQPRESGR